MSRVHGHGGHSHGRVDESILRSRAGLRAVAVSLAVLGATAAAQAFVFALSGSVALLADLIHNAGDALTAVPVGAAFLLRSRRAERWAGYFVVGAILVSACVALYETVQRLVDPQELEHLWPLAGAGLLGFAGNELAARVRLRAGRRLHSAALVADGNHARADGFVSLAVVASAAAVAAGVEIADPLIGLAITLVILRICLSSWRTVRADEPADAHSDGPAQVGHVIHWARRYDLRMAARTLGREGAFRREHVELARLAPGESVLDIGCGTGRLAVEAKRRVGPHGAVFGIDPSPEMVARARRRARRAGLDVTFETAAAQRLPFANGRFDAVVATLVLHELPREDVPVALAEIARVLKPGGRVLVVDIGGEQTARHTPHAPTPGHAHWDLEHVVVPSLGGARLRAVESGPLAFRLRRFERLRYVLAAAASTSPADPRAAPEIVAQSN